MKENKKWHIHVISVDKVMHNSELLVTNYCHSRCVREVE